jgi:inosine-uridine nucleoside N-ribohydrolase
MADARPFIVDTDCGIDDAIALMMLLASPAARLIGVTTVSGNVGVEQVTENVRRLLAYFGHGDVPVYRGASRALLQGVVRAEGVHGANGLGGVELPPVAAGGAPDTASRAPGAPRAPRAPAALAQLFEAHSGATLVTLGPMTNLAMALNLYPEMRQRIGRLVAMGGAIETGNITRFAEFNFYADPEAVQFVLNTGIPLELVPWDACVSHRFSRDDLDSFAIPVGPAGELFDTLQDFVFRRTERIYGTPFTVHPDPMAMAYALDPSVAESYRITGLTMELGSSTLRGASVRTEGENVTAIMDVNVSGYAAHLRRIGQLGVTHSASGESSE